MSVQSEINRLATAKTAIGTAIAGKGVDVPSGTKLDGMAALIEGIEQGSEPVLQEKTVTPATSAQSVTPDSGYDGLSKVTVNAMPTATQATPSISVSSAGLITASATQTAGYVAAGTKSATKQLTVQAAQTITPGTSNKTIASGRYLTGTQTIKGDANLVSGNIAKDVTIFGVTGTHEGGEDVSAETAEYTSLLTDLETAIDALPDAGSGGSSGGIEYEIVTIPAGANSVNVSYSLPRVTAAYGCTNETGIEFQEAGIIMGIFNNTLQYVTSVDIIGINSDIAIVSCSDSWVLYENGIMSAYIEHTVPHSVSVILINDPSAPAISN